LVERSIAKNTDFKKRNSNGNTLDSAGELQSIMRENPFDMAIDRMRHRIYNAG
jgi:hypothetical protein